MSLTNTTAAPTLGRRPRSAISVEELRRAWSAVQSGDFRRHTTSGSARTAPPTRSAGDAPGNAEKDAGGHSPSGRPRVWAPAVGEHVLPVLGCAGSAGTTTVALAVALAAARVADIPARVVECCSMAASGLAAASHAELGLHDTGWRQGRREQVLLERADDMFERPADVPTPSPVSGTDGDRSLTVLDGGWDLNQLLAAPSWLRETVCTCPTVIAVAPATVPGLRRLEVAVEHLGADRIIAALLGPDPRKWPNAVTHSVGPRTRRLLEQGRVQAIPHDRGLAVHGLGSTPLPPRLLRAAANLLALSDLESPIAADTNTASNDHAGRRATP